MPDFTNIVDYVSKKHYNGERKDEILNKLQSDPNAFNKALNDMWASHYTNVDEQQFTEAYMTKYGFKKKSQEQPVSEPTTEDLSVGSQNEPTQESVAPKQFTQEEINDIANSKLPLNQRIGKALFGSLERVFKRYPQDVVGASALTDALSLNNTRDQLNTLMLSRTAKMDPEAAKELQSKYSGPMLQKYMNMSDEEFEASKTDLQDRVQKKEAAITEAMKYIMSKRKDAKEADYTDKFSQIDNPIEFLEYVASASGEGIAQIPASIITMGLSSLVQESGSIYSDQIEQIQRQKSEELGRDVTVDEIIEKGWDDPAMAGVYAVSAAALDRLGAGTATSGVIKKVLGKQIKEKALYQIGKGMVVEGATEGAQTGLEQVGSLRDIDWAEIGEGAAKGFFAAGPMSAASATMSQDNGFEQLDNYAGQQLNATEDVTTQEQQNDEIQRPNEESPTPDSEQPTATDTTLGEDTPTREDRADVVGDVQDSSQSADEAGLQGEEENVTEKTSKKVAPKNLEIESVDDAIAEMFRGKGGYRISRDSWNSGGDTKIAKDDKAMRLFYLSQKGGMNIDEVAQDLKDVYPQFENMDEKEIAESIVDFIRKNPGGPKNYIDSRISTQSDINNYFEEGAKKVFGSNPIPDQTIGDVKQKLSSIQEDIVNRVTEGYFSSDNILISSVKDEINQYLADPDNYEGGFLVNKDGSPKFSMGEINELNKIVNEELNQIAEGRSGPTNEAGIQSDIDQQKEGDGQTGPYDSDVVISSGFGGIKSIDTSKILPSESISPKKIFQEYFTPRGNVPRQVFQETNKAKGRVNKAIQKVNFIHSDFNKALKKVYGKTILGVPKAKQAELNKINNVLSRLGTDPSNRAKVLNELPEELRGVVSNMRNHIDQLSEELKRSGLIQGDLEGKIDENLGYYLTRTYRVHKDKSWNWDTIPDTIKNKAYNVVKASNPDLSFEEIDGLMKSWVNNPNVTWGFQKDGIASKDLGILKKRKDIDKSIRDLLGEYTDPFYNYATSIAKMANLIENHKVLSFIEETGRKQGWLHDKPTGDYHVQIAGKGSQVKSPINGLYTTKELADAINRFNDNEPLPTWLRYYMKANSLVKYGKTILSPMTHSRNFISNGALQLANGRFGVVEGIDTFKNVKDMVMKKDDAALREYIGRLNELGVINDTVLTGELQDTLKDAVEYFEDFDRYGDSSFKKAFKMARRASERAYQIEDDIHKMYAFEIEKSRYERVFKNKYPDKSEQEIINLAEERAAEIVRMTMPTYSLVPKAIKALRRWPVTGSFVSFPAEIFRVTYNTQRLWAKELGDPSTRSIGLKRALGSATAATFTSAAAVFRQIALGLDEEDDDKFKRFLPPWSKFSDVIMIDNKGDGKYTYIDLGFSDPHNYLKKGYNAASGLFKKNTSKKQVLMDTLNEMFEPFLGEEILVSRLLDVSRNKKKSSGLPVYNESLPLGDQFMEMVQYMTEGLEPGAISSARRINKAFRNKLGDYGQSSTPTDEILNVILGQKIQTLDIGFNYKYKLRNTGDQVKDALSIYSWQLKKKEGSTQEEKDEAYNKASDSVQRIIDEARNDYQAALKLGVPIEKLDDRIDNMYVGPYKAGRILRNAIKRNLDIEISKKTGKLIYSN